MDVKGAGTDGIGIDIPPQCRSLFKIPHTSLQPTAYTNVDGTRYA